MMNSFIFKKSLAVVVINSCLQLALGNIYISFLKGVNVCLNYNNIMYKCLFSHWFYLLLIDDLEKSNLNDNLALQKYKTMFEIFENPRIDNFQENIKK